MNKIQTSCVGTSRSLDPTRYPDHLTHHAAFMVSIFNGVDASTTKLSFVTAGIAINFSHWNHAKIIAVDGKYMLTGGHNLWDVAYLKAAPVTDTSVQLEGSVVQGAHRFLDYIWHQGCKLSGLSKTFRDLHLQSYNV